MRILRKRWRLERPGEIALLDEGIGNKHGAERSFAGWGHEVEILIPCGECKQIYPIQMCKGRVQLEAFI